MKTKQKPNPLKHIMSNEEKIRAIKGDELCRMKWFHSEIDEFNESMTCKGAYHDDTSLEAFDILGFLVKWDKPRYLDTIARLLLTEDQAVLIQLLASSSYSYSRWKFKQTRRKRVVIKHPDLIAAADYLSSILLERPELTAEEEYERTKERLLTRRHTREAIKLPSRKYREARKKSKKSKFK